MPPELPPFLVILDAALDDNQLRGRAEYIEPEVGLTNIRVRWGFGAPPAEYKEEGAGLVFVADQRAQPRAADEHAPIRPIEGDRYAYSEGLGNAPWFMFAMVLPAGYTLAHPDEPSTAPHGSRIFGDRLAVYWRLYPNKKDPASAGIEWKLQSMGNDLGEELRRLGSLGTRPWPTPEEPEPDHLVFVSYRQEGAEWEAGRIDDALVAEFGRERVFRDLHSMRPGRDFRDQLDAAVGRCKAMLVIIDKNWLDPPKTRGQRRIDNEEDWVRIEVESALQRHIPVVPLLLGQFRMPEAEELPISIRQLVYRQSLSVRGRDFATDMERVIEELRCIEASAEQA